MDFNLIEELSKEFNSKIKFRHLSLRSSEESKLRLEFVPKLKPKRSYANPTPIFLNPLSKLNRIKTPHNKSEDKNKIKKLVKNFEYNSAATNENLHLSDSTEEPIKSNGHKGIIKSDNEIEISDSESDKDDLKICPFKKSKNLAEKSVNSFGSKDDVPDEFEGLNKKGKRNSILKFLENKRRNTYHVDNYQGLK